jgi:hypothetical protein
LAHIGMVGRSRRSTPMEENISYLSGFVTFKDDRKADPVQVLPGLFRQQQQTRPFSAKRGRLCFVRTKETIDTPRHLTDSSAMPDVGEYEFLQWSNPAQVTLHEIPEHAPASLGQF